MNYLTWQDTVSKQQKPKTKTKNKNNNNNKYFYRIDGANVSRIKEAPIALQRRGTVVDKSGFHGLRIATYNKKSSKNNNEKSNDKNKNQNYKKYII